MGWVKPVTLWWNRLTWPRRIFGLVTISFLFLCLIFIGRLYQSVAREISCLNSHCTVEGIFIDLVDEVPLRYEITAEFPDQKRTLICDHTKNSLEDNLVLDGDKCLSYGAFFYIDSRNPPPGVRVSLLAGDRQITKTYHPLYSSNSPNGHDCGCLKATIRMYLSE